MYAITFFYKLQLFDVFRENKAKSTEELLFSNSCHRATILKVERKFTMSYILLFITILCSTIQTAARKEYVVRLQSGTFIFCGASMLFAALFFVFKIDGFSFSWNALLYATLWSLCSIGGSSLTLYALKIGPLALTSLIGSFGMIVPALLGIAFLSEPVTANLVFGLILLVISLILLNMKNKYDNGKRPSFKWFVLAVLASLISNCSSFVQKVQQQNLQGAYENEIMLVAFLIVAVVNLVLALIFERNCFKRNIVRGLPMYASFGLLVGIVNMIVLNLALTLPASLIFPVIGAGGLVLNSLLSVIVYKERLGTPQLLSIALGISAIIFLNM